MRIKDPCDPLDRIPLTQLRLGSGLIDPEDCDGGESDGGEEDVGTSIIASVDASPVLEACEHVFDAVALPEEDRVIGILYLAKRMRRDAGVDTALGEGLAEPTAVIGPIAKQDAALGHGGHDRFGTLMVVALAFGEMEPKRTPPAIADHMELGRQAAPATPDTSG